MPDENGSNNDVPGGYGTATGARNGADGPGGAINDYATPVTTSPSVAVPEVLASKQIEHPLNTPVATTVFAGGYSDSTGDASTGASQHNAGNVDLTIGETFSYIITVTFPEGTTARFVPLDSTAPTSFGDDRRFRLVEILGAEVIHVGANLSGPGLYPTGYTSFPIIDTNGDGDLDFIGLDGNSSQDVVNTPDNVTNDNDRYVIRINARLDDEDASGGAADNLPNVSNNKGNVAGNRLQFQWRNSNNVDTLRNILANIDIVEPTLTLTKTASTNLAGQGETVAFTLTLTNTGTAPAYDVVFTDTLPFLGGTNYFSFASINAAASTCDNRVGYGATTGTPISSFDFDNLLMGESCTLVINAIVQNTTTFDTIYTNNASITSYRSRPGNPADVRVYPAVNASADVEVTDPVTITFDSATSSAAEAAGIGNVLRVTTASGSVTSAAITVPISVTGGSATAGDYTLGGTITIPAGTASNSLVSIASGFSVSDDAVVEPDETVDLQLSAPSGNAALGAQTTHTHTMQNDDTTTLTIGDSAIVEGNAGTSTLNLTVTSSAEVQGSFTVAYSLTDGTATIVNNDYAATGSLLTFTGAAGETHIIPVTINGDLDIEANETFTASFGAISGTTLGQANFVRSDTGTGTINNDDTAAITVTPTTIAIAEGGATATFSLVSSTNTTSTVDIPLTTDGQCLLSSAANPIPSTTLTVTLPIGSGTAISVTVEAVNDTIAEGAHTCVITTGDPSSADANYNTLGAVDVADVTAAITDNDTSGITLSTITITEGVAGVPMDVVLTSEPTGDVTITLTPDAQCTLSTNILTFTGSAGTAPWNMAQSVTVTAADDAIAEGAHTCVITYTAASSDANYTLAVTNHNVSVTDNDTAGLTFSTIIITEGVAGVPMDVVLLSEPTGDVTITLTPDAQCTLSTNILTFTGSAGAAPWNMAQSVTVTAVDDAIAEGAHTCVISYTAASSDANYTIAATNHTVDVVDNDTPGIFLATVTVTEGRAGVAMDVRLFTEPTGDVTITLTPDAQCTLAPTTLTFTNGAGATPWNIAQPVTVTAVDDLRVEASRHTCVLAVSSTSSDGSYNSLAVPHSVTVRDNENADNDNSHAVAPALPVETFLCSNLRQQTNGAMTGSGDIGNVEQNGAYGNTYCTILVLNGEYRRNPAEIGIAAIIEQGVVQALDVYGLLPAGASVVPFQTPVQICYAGSGSVYFLSSFAGNPPPVQLPQLSSSPAGYTCVSVPNSGKVILTSTPSTLPPAPAPSTTLVQGACQVTTTFAVRLRTTPDASSDANVITTLPFDLTLVATEYVPGWYRVIYLDGQGWVSEQYVATIGHC